MSFGAEVLAGGGVRFRLWAPAARSVDLVFHEKMVSLQRQEGGWFEVVEASAKAGSLYRYRIDSKELVPDPASRFQPKDVDGPSEVIDPAAFVWRDDGWRGRRWSEAVICELHVGAFSPQGTFAGVGKKLRYLKEAGITAIELMPVADFPGRRNWGYDGVLPYAPDSRYGRPEDLKALVQDAHAAGLMVLLDVVYNHFGPKGNYLGLYAPQFFTERHKTPWGAAIDFSNPVVREYFIRNALYWIDEFHIDGLRFDAVHAIFDDSPRHVLLELNERVREAVGGHRHVHLILENDANQSGFLGPEKFTAQWNDDSHHAYHVLATGERDGYYVAYADAPAKHLARCLAEGFAYQGEVSPFTNEPRGEASTELPPAAFVDFLQNHDQIGNRALGERLVALADERIVRCLTAIQLLAPSPPLLFMGEEWGCKQPFLFFCDFPGELGDAVRKGRREEFARFAAFSDAAARSRIPDPLAESTFRRSALRWKDRSTASAENWLAHYRALLDVRAKDIAPRAQDAKRGRYRMLAERAFEVSWPLGSRASLILVANCSTEALEVDDPPARLLWSSNDKAGAPWSATWWLQE